jgi:hypothetical protein
LRIDWKGLQEPSWEPYDFIVADVKELVKYFQKARPYSAWKENTTTLVSRYTNEDLAKVHSTYFPL